MSIKIIEEQIKNFLSNDTPEIMSINGAWGIGKTYTRKKYFNECKEAKKIVLEKYAYISLFGIEDIQQLKFELFYRVKDIYKVGNCSTNRIFGLASKKIKELRPSFSISCMGVKIDAMEALKTFGYSQLKNTIFCIDDFERSNLKLEDMLGIFSNLKEEKNCKIVLIFNEEELKDNKDVYKKYQEKVIDYEIEFSPTSEEATNIAIVDGDKKLNKLLKENIIKLQINNIRIIKKIERFAKTIYFELQDKDFELEILEKAIKTLVVSTWSKYASGENVIDFAFLKKFSAYLARYKKDEELLWHDRLVSYGFTDPTPFDTEIFNLVEFGYLDKEKFNLLATEFNKDIISLKNEDRFYKAWNSFHYSFKKDKKQVISEMDRSLRKAVDKVSPTNLDGTVRLFRSLGEEKKADELIDFYINNRRDDRNLFDIENYLFEVKDEKIRDKFEKEFNSGYKIRPVEDILSKMDVGARCTREEEFILSQASKEEFYNLFKKTEGKDLDKFIEICLQFDPRRTNSNNKQREEIYNNVVNALKDIANESDINRLRVKKYLNIDEDK